MVPRLGCALEGFLHWPARDRENFTHGNPAVSLTRYGFFLPLAETEEGRVHPPRRDAGDTGDPAASMAAFFDEHR